MCSAKHGFELWLSNSNDAIKGFRTLLFALGETRETIEQKLDSIFNLGPFMAAREHILGDAFDGKKFWDMKNPNIQEYIIRVARAMYLSNVKSLDEHIGLLINFSRL